MPLPTEVKLPEPVAWCDDRAKDGDVGNCASVAAKTHWERGGTYDRMMAAKYTNPLYTADQMRAMYAQGLADAQRWQEQWAIERGMTGHTHERFMCVRNLETQLGQDFYATRDPLMVEFLASLAPT